MVLVNFDVPTLYTLLLDQGDAEVFEVSKRLGKFLDKNCLHVARRQRPQILVVHRCHRPDSPTRGLAGRAPTKYGEPEASAPGGTRRSVRRGETPGTSASGSRRSKQ